MAFIAPGLIGKGASMVFWMRWCGEDDCGSRVGLLDGVGVEEEEKMFLRRCAGSTLSGIPY